MTSRKLFAGKTVLRGITLPSRVTPREFINKCHKWISSPFYQTWRHWGEKGVFFRANFPIMAPSIQRPLNSQSFHEGGRIRTYESSEFRVYNGRQRVGLFEEVVYGRWSLNTRAWIIMGQIFSLLEYGNCRDLTHAPMLMQCFISCKSQFRGKSSVLSNVWEISVSCTSHEYDNVITLLSVLRSIKVSSSRLTES